MNTDLLWAIAVMLLLGLLKLGVAELQAWRGSKSAQEHPALLPLAAVGLDVANAAIAWLSNNPAAKASDALAWAISEWKASAPDLITAAGSAATDASLKFAMTRKLLTAAQSSNLTDAASKVIADLSPSISTARVTPAQLTAVKADVVAAAPPAIEDIANALLTKFPGLAALVATPAAPAAPTATADPAAPVVQPAAAPA
jgi:hypothetical protein